MNKLSSILFAAVSLTLMSGLVAAQSNSAQAETVLVEKLGSRLQFKDAEFRFDPKGTDSWVNIHYVVHEPAGGGGINFRHKFLDRPVPGLWFDAPSAQILFDGASTGRVVCANVKEKNGYFGKKWIITLTGACRTFGAREAYGTSVYFQAR